jgi:PAS domain S-box-containing protein
MGASMKRLSRLKNQLKGRIYALFSPTGADAGAGRIAEEERFQLFVDSIIERLPNMVFVKEARQLRFVRFNKAGEDLLGISREELLGRNDYDLFPKDQADFFTSKDREVLSGRQVVDIAEEPIETRARGRRILHTRKIPILSPAGEPEFLLGISEDITELMTAEADRLRATREHAALEEREQAARRAAFLAEASTMLASSLDYHDTLRKLAETSVRTLADWCTITILSEDRGAERVAAVHADPALTPLIDELRKYSPVDERDAPGIARVIRTGKSSITREVPDSDLVAAAKDARHLELMRTLGCASCMIVPLEVRGKVHGAIAFVSSQASRLYESPDVALAEELGRRAAIAVDNAFLYETAQKAIRARDEFLSIASHELKTPLTSLKLQLQITRKQTNPEAGVLPQPRQLARMLDVSSLQVNRLSTLIEDLLDISRIESGKLSYRFEPIDLAELAAEMVERYETHLRAAGCAVTLDASGPVMAMGDRSRLEQVVLNLLTNTAKYGAGNPVRISVGMDQGKAMLACEDQGIGIPPDKLDKVFERFERAVSSSNVSGLGLGLYITREIVRAHGGEISVSSELGKGSVFTVSLPGQAVVPG